MLPSRSVLLLVFHWSLLAPVVSTDRGGTCEPSCRCYDHIIDCDRTRLRTLPTNVPQNADTIYARQNRIRVLLRSHFENLRHVRHILMANNNVRRVEDTAFKDMVNLVSLSLENNRIKTLSTKTFRRLVNLRALSLAGNHLRTTENLLNRARKLFFLDLSNNRIGAISNRAFRSNTQLRAIDLHGNRIRTLARNAFRTLPYLKYLVLRDNPLFTANLFFRLNENLEMLDLTNCQLRQIPKELPSTLNDLRLQENFITNITVQDLQGSKNIRLLILSKNNISSIENHTLGQLDSLDDLHLDHNLLSELPGDLPRSLQGLHANFNNITKVDRNLLGRSPLLEEVGLSNNHIEFLDSKAFRGLERLKKLKLNWNVIKNISSLTFMNNHRLQLLDLSHNPLNELSYFCFHGLDGLHILQMAAVDPNPRTLQPSVFRHARSLQFLDLSGSPSVATKLIRKPVYISSVRDLNLMYDNLENIPRTLPSQMKNLEMVKLSGNPWHCDIEIYPLTIWMRNKSVDFYLREEVRCVTPNRLEGRQIETLTLDDLTVPSHIIPDVQIDMDQVSREGYYQGTHLQFHRSRTHQISLNANRRRDRGRQKQNLSYQESQNHSNQDVSNENSSN